MITGENLLIRAENCLNSGDIDCAEKILKKLQKMEKTPELTYIISQLLMDLGSKKGKIDFIDEAITNFENLKEFNLEGINFYLGTAYALKYHILKEKPKYLTKNYKNHLLFKSKIALREELSASPNVYLRKTLMNLANVYDDIGRIIEAIDFYEAIISQCGSAYALLNKAISLYEYSYFIIYPTPILADSYSYFNYISTHPNSSDELKRKANFYIDKIKFLFDENILDENVKNDLKRPSDETFESFMINYCLDNRLYLNLCNFCQRCENAIGDTIGIEKMIIEISDGAENDRFLILSSYLNQLKMDYVSARFLLILSQYDGFDLDIITKHVFIVDTLFSEENNIRIQLLKDAFKNFFNILDKIAYFMNDYLKLDIGQNRVNFRSVWFKYKYDKKKKRNIKFLNKKLIDMNNAGLTALYDIYLELEYGNEKDYLRKTRNSLTHKYLRITENQCENSKTIEELHNETIEVAILAKNAIIYLMRLVKINEEQNEIELDVEFEEIIR